MLGPGQIPVIRSSYTHMLAEDMDVWRRYLNREGHLIDQVWYDVHVGTPVAVPEGSPEFLTAVAMGVTRKRIDVVILRSP